VNECGAAAASAHGFAGVFSDDVVEEEHKNIGLQHGNVH
jgi:hypothetical protein